MLLNKLEIKKAAVIVIASLKYWAKPNVLLTQDKTELRVLIHNMTS